MGRKKKRVKSAPSFLSLRASIRHLVCLDAWYECAEKSFFDGKVSQNITDDDRDELAVSLDREAIRIIEDASRLINKAMDDLLVNREKENFCQRWVDLLVPEYWKINNGEQNAEELRSKFVDFLDFNSGNFRMLPPATAKGNASLREKEGRFNSLNKFSASDYSEEMNKFIDILTLDSGEILKLGGPKKAAYNQVANYIGSNPKTVARNYKTASERIIAGEKYFKPFDPSLVELTNFMSGVSAKCSKFNKQIKNEYEIFEI